MRARRGNAWRIGAGLGATIVVISASVMALGACATGVDPVRPAASGSGGSTSSASVGAGLGASSTSSGLGGSSTSSSTGGTSSTTVTSTTSGTSSTTVTSSTSSTSTSASSSTSSTSTSASSSSGTPVMGLHVEYLCADTMASDNNMKPHLKIVNGGTSAVAYSSLSVRYFFTEEGNPPLVFECDYAVLGCSNLQGSYSATTGTEADHYLELTFAAGLTDLAPGTDSGEMQLRLHNQDFSALNQANDYSFDPTKTAYADWSNVTLYQNGTLVWGTEP